MRRRRIGPARPWSAGALSAVALCAALLGAGLSGCAPEPDPPGPFELAEEATWKAVNRSDRGSDGIFVQATWRTFAYEIIRIYGAAEEDDLGQEQVESRLREMVHSFIDGRYPVEDGTDINNLYFQYLIYVDPDFDPGNPIQKSQFDAWRSQYVRRLLGFVTDRKYPMLRPHYDERWGLTLYSRLVFSIYLNGEDADLQPRIDDIGARTVLVDEDGNRYRPSGTAGPYPYEFDRPRTDYLHKHAVYRVFFPNRKADRTTPIVTAQTERVALVIEGLGDQDERRLTWDLPLAFPEVKARRLVVPADSAAPAAP